MATKAIDAFTGADDVDITGRVPDGGGAVAMAVGEWDRVTDSFGVGTFDILASAFAGGRSKSAGNVASIDVDLPERRVVGSLLGILVYTSDNVSRSPQEPTDWTTAADSTSAGKIVLYQRICDGTEADTVTLTFAGVGAAGTDQLTYAFVLDDVAASPIGQIGADSAWLSADNLGPVTGLTPDAADSIVLLCAAKQNDFSGSATATGFSLGAITERTSAGMVLMWLEQAGGPSAIGDATITDTGGTASNGAGVGFMLEIKRGSTSPSRCCQRTPTGLQDWVHYVAKDIPGVGGVTGITDYMVEGTWDVFSVGNGFFGLIARHHEDTISGYEISLVPPSADPTDPATLELIYWWEGALTELRTVSVSVDYSQPVKLRFCVSGPSSDVNLKVYVNDIRIIPDDGTLDPLGTFIHNPPGGQEIDGGWPGACMEDGTRNGTGFKLKRWRAAESCDDGEIPCEGPPENPYPTDPPPLPTPPTAGEYPMQRGIWRTPVVPSWGMRAGAFRSTGAALEEIRKWLMANGIWREVSNVAGETDPPPDTDFPPHYDPCELLPPGDLPPTEPLGPPPARIFFAWTHPITQLGPLFTGAPNAMGAHTPGNIAQAAARSSVIIGAQGGYDKFISGGRYQPALMDAWIASLAPVMGSVLVSQTAGDLYGISVMDDHASAPRWPPSGISVSEISRIVAVWKTLYPGIRIGLRARAAQFSGSNIPANVDFIIAQYRYWGIGQTPAQFRDTELNLCAARGWKILFSINIENGGLGGSGITHRVMFEMTPAEVTFAWLEMLDLPDAQLDDVHGLGLWQYSSAVFGRAGMLDAFAIGRNRLQELGAPP